MHVSDLHLFTVMHATSAKDAWDTLKSQQSASAKSQSLLLRRKMIDFKMGPNQSVLQYVNAAMVLQQDFVLAGKPMLAEEAVNMVLAGLPDRFSTVVQILQHSIDSLTMHDCLTKLLVAEQMVAAREEEPTAYYGHADRGNRGVLKRVRFPEDGGSSRAGLQHDGGGGRQSGGGGQRSGQFGRSTGGGGPFRGTCWHCNEVGHIKADCAVFTKAKKQRAEKRAYLAAEHDLGATGDAM
jgi:uncharacterized membrane protein YgcG